MSRIEQLRKRLTLIQEQAVQQETVRKQVRLKEEEREKRKLEAVLVERRLANENWSLIKGKVLKIFQELGKEVLNEKGTILDWRIKESFYTDTWYEYKVPAFDAGGEYPESCDRKASVEVAELRINGIGKVAVFRPIEVAEEVRENYYSSISEEDLETMRKWMWIGYFSPKENKELDRVLGPKVPCGLNDRDFEGELRLSLVQPSARLIAEVGDSLPEVLVALHKRALLEQ